MRCVLWLLPMMALCTSVSAEVLRGVVRSASSGEVLPGAVAELRECQIHAMADPQGSFLFEEVPTGRYTLQVHLLGYETYVLPALLVSGKHDVRVEVLMHEKPTLLQDVVVEQDVQKIESSNPLTIMGVRRMTIEETQRIAGSFEDPMRTAGATPGITSQVGDNGISVHGNPPSTVCYHIEGAEIPSPNHFSDAMGYGGSFVSSMKTSMLSDWDLFSSVPSAEYGNTLGAVLDYNLRAGNNRKNEFTLKAGVLGLEAMAEGPLGKNGASYLVDYRYAMTSLAYDLGLILLNDEMFDFQDYSFKLQFPTKRGGTLSVWSLGQMNDHYWTLTQLGEEAEDVENLHVQDCRQYLYIGGVDHVQPLQNNWKLKWTAVASQFKNNNVDSYYPDPYSSEKNDYLTDNQLTSRATLSGSLQHRINRHVLFKGGVQYTHYLFDYLFARRSSLFDLRQRVRQDGSYQIGLGNAFAESLIEVGNWRINVGASMEGMTNGTSWDFEPRFSALYRLSPTQSLSVGLARSRMMPSLDNIFYENAQYEGMGDGSNLEMMGSNQSSLSYRWQPQTGFSMMAEVYADFLDHLPVGVVDPTYCVLNRFLFDQSQPLESSGMGRNLGLVLGVDQYMKHGFYYMVNAMLFDNRWKGKDHVWRNTRQNRQWKLCASAGKEWMTGKNHRDVLCLNASVNSMGGLYDTPALLDETRQNYYKGIPYVAYDKSQALTQKYTPTTLVNISATYRINRTKKFSQLIGFEWMNVLMQGELWTQRYDFKHDNIADVVTMTSLPNLYYQIDF